MISVRRAAEFCKLKVFNILIILSLLAACASPSNHAPVQSRQQPASNKLGFHRVAGGETLFSIAWRYGMDYRELARRNDIPKGYTIYPGQKLYLYRDVSKKSVSPKPKQQKKTIKSSTKAVSVTPPKRSKSSTPSKSPSVKAATPSKGLAWRWPSRGKLLSSFSSRKGMNKGIDITGRLGEPVFAAAPGLVVYAGSGIRGYGNLLIIKHDDIYLSAYAHNSKLLVKERETVKVGQKIAEIGKSGTDRYKLHFEIRRNGKPTDPIRYLPKR